jgi:hypothetical protein
MVVSMQNMIDLHTNQFRQKFNGLLYTVHWRLFHGLLEELQDLSSFQQLEVQKKSH